MASTDSELNELYPKGLLPGRRNPIFSILQLHIDDHILYFSGHLCNHLVFQTTDDKKHVCKRCTGHSNFNVCIYHSLY
jgi:hypothetical protein